MDWVKHEANQFHKGSELTIIEIYDGVPTAQSGWQLYRDVKRIKKRMCPSRGPHTYDKQYEQYIIDSYSDLFPKWFIYDNAKSDYNSLDGRSFYVPYKVHHSIRVV